jgi:hypothetical protein
MWNYSLVPSIDRIVFVEFQNNNLILIKLECQLGARRSAAQAITHRLLSVCKESKIPANQGRVFNQRY